MTFEIGTIAATTELIDCLNELRFKTPGITDMAIVSLEGLPIASLILDNVNEARFSAMTAATISLGERVVSELQKGIIKKILIEGNQGFVITMQAGENAVITVSTTPNAKLGLLFLDLERASKKIAQILS